MERVNPRFLYSIKELAALCSFAVLLNALCESLACGGVAGLVVAGVDVELNSAVLENLGGSTHSHPYVGNESDCREGSDEVLDSVLLVGELLDFYRCILQRAAVVNYIVGNLEEVLSAGVSRLLVSGILCRTENDNLHTNLLCLEGNLDYRCKV